MKNIRSFIIGSSFVIAAWLTAAFFADTTTSEQPAPAQVISASSNSL